MSESDRITRLEEKSKFYDQFFTDIKTSIDDLKDSIIGLGREMKKERKQEAELIYNEVLELKNSIKEHIDVSDKRLGIFAIFLDYKPLTAVLFLLYTALMIKESRDMILSFLGLK